jgi:hypothetical protein
VDNLPKDEVWHDGADEDDEGVGGQQRRVEHDEEVEELAVELEREPDDGGVGGRLEQEEGEVGDEPRDDVGGGAVRVVRRLPDEDEALLDEGRHGVVGGEEEDADGEDEEAEAVGDALRVVLGLGEHGGHQEPHHRQHHQPRQEQLRRAPDVGEVAPHQHPHLPDVRVGELAPVPQRVDAHPGGARRVRGRAVRRRQVVVLVHRVRAAQRRRRSHHDVRRVPVVAGAVAGAWPPVLLVLVPGAPGRREAHAAPRRLGVLAPQAAIEVVVVAAAGTRDWRLDDAGHSGQPLGPVGGGELGRLQAGEAELGQRLHAELRLLVLLDDVQEVLDGALPLGHLAPHAAKVRGHLLGPTAVHELPARQDDEVVQQQQDARGRLVDGEHHGATGARDVVHLLDHAVRARRVQPRRRLVQEQKRRPVDDVHADRDAPALAAGHPPRALISDVRVSRGLHA